MHCDQKPLEPSADSVKAYTDPIHSGFPIQFHEGQTLMADPKLSELIAEKCARKEFFYGIELMAHAAKSDTELDYTSFGQLLPLFTSIVWLGNNYCKVEPISNVPAIQLALQLRTRTIALPHFSCYQVDQHRLDAFLQLNFKNILAVLGDQVSVEQEFKHTSDMVAAIRQLKGDSISIGVAGYPEGHPDANTLEDDMNYLVKKVEAGADFIITQLCFSIEAILQFLKNCRTRNIRVPIIVGVYVADNLSSLQRLARIAKVQIPAQLLQEYARLSDNENDFREYAIQSTIQIIQSILASNLGVYGVQFYTMNKFDNIRRVLTMLDTSNI